MRITVQIIRIVQKAPPPAASFIERPASFPLFRFSLWWCSAKREKNGQAYGQTLEWRTAGVLSIWVHDQKTIPYREQHAYTQYVFSP